MCTIAACSSFPEPFLTPPGQKRLAFSHKKFAGHRSSDHLAMLSAFHQWERTRYVGTCDCHVIKSPRSCDLVGVMEKKQSRPSVTLIF